MSPETTPAAEATKATRRIVGRVVSNKMDKTITVLVERRVKHPLYGKYVVRSTKLHAHDADNAAKEGDVVAVTETRPLSRLKRHRLVEILESTAG